MKVTYEANIHQDQMNLKILATYPLDELPNHSKRDTLDLLEEIRECILNDHSVDPFLPELLFRLLLKERHG